MSHEEVSIETKRANIIVVGGGVIGLSIARELAHRGVSDIVLFDKGELGKEASWAAGGILAPQVEADRADDFFKLATASRDLYPAFAQALHDETGIDVELDQTGTLYVAFNEVEELELRQRLVWQQRTGLRVQWLTSEDLRRVEPNISSAARCALRFPDDWQIENRRLVEALIAANERLGVRLIPKCEVKLLRVEHDRVLGVAAENGMISARVVIVCAGAWTSSLAIRDSVSIQVEPVRGQMLCFKPNQQLARHVIYSRRGYLVPRRDGRLLAGSTSETVGFDKRVTDEGVKAIRLTASEIAPGIASLPFDDSWAGFRPRASDDRPIIGPDDEIEGLFYASGHYRNGILLAPITAKLLANKMIDGSTDRLQVFSPNRFRLAAATR